MARKLRPQITLLIDTREQRPLVFPDNITEVITFSGVGDYSIRYDWPDRSIDFRDRICLERKSLQDLQGCIPHVPDCHHREIGNDPHCSKRCRFERELVKLARLERAAIIIEATLEQVLQGPSIGEVHPHAVIGSLFSWYADYNVPPIFCGDRDLAAATVRKILVKFAEHHVQGEPQADIFGLLTGG